MRIRVYPGQYYDSETGLHYNWHRDYYPAAGRYIESDPVGVEGGINLYAYVQNDPLNTVDPEGLCVSPGTSPSDIRICEGYKPFFSSTCKDDGNIVKDQYPEKAYKCCQDIILRYDGKPKLYRVGECLIEEEAKCQKKECCDDRALCRVVAHFKCYIKWRFIPTRGYPPSYLKIVFGR